MSLSPFSFRISPYQVLFSFSAPFRQVYFEFSSTRSLAGVYFWSDWLQSLHIFNSLLWKRAREGKNAWLSSLLTNPCSLNWDDCNRRLQKYGRRILKMRRPGYLSSSPTRNVAFSSRTRRNLRKRRATMESGWVGGRKFGCTPIKRLESERQLPNCNDNSVLYGWRLRDAELMADHGEGKVYMLATAQSLDYILEKGWWGTWRTCILAPQLGNIE